MCRVMPLFLIHRILLVYSDERMTSYHAAQRTVTISHRPHHKRYSLSPPLTIAHSLSGRCCRDARAQPGGCLVIKTWIIKIVQLWNASTVRLARIGCACTRYVSIEWSQCVLVLIWRKICQLAHMFPTTAISLLSGTRQRRSGHFVSSSQNRCYGEWT